MSIVNPEQLDDCPISFAIKSIRGMLYGLSAEAESELTPKEKGMVVLNLQSDTISDMPKKLVIKVSDEKGNALGEGSVDFTMEGATIEVMMQL